MSPWRGDHIIALVGRLALRAAWPYSLAGWSLLRPASAGLDQDWLGELFPEFTRLSTAVADRRGQVS
jgi:hypothetical protein